MKSIIDLPMELLEKIADATYMVEELNPFNIENFSLVCKVFFSACSKAPKSALRRHYEMKRTWRCAGSQDDRGRRAKDGYIQRLLREVLDNPRITRYIERLCLREWSIRFDINDDHSQRWPWKDFRIYDEAMGILHFESELEKQKWGMDLEEGNETVLIAILLHHLPKISTLQWQVANDEDMKNILGLVGRSDWIGKQKPLSLLQEVVMDIDMKGTVNARTRPHLRKLAFVESIMAIPSVQYAHIVGSRFERTNLFGGKTCNITKLQLTGFGPYEDYNTILDGLFAPLKTLKTFEFRTPTWGYSAFDPIPLKDTLLKHFGGALEEMVISRGTAEATRLNDMSGFEKLRYLELDLSIFIVRISENISRFLPASLEHLRLHEDNDVGISICLKSLAQMVRTRETFLPKLARIDLHMASAEALNGILEDDASMRALFQQCRDIDARHPESRPTRIQRAGRRLRIKMF